MTSQHERRLQPRSMPDTFARIEITRVNARVPMNRAEQRLALLIWVCSICIALLTLSKAIELLCRLFKALA